MTVECENKNKNDVALRIVLYLMGLFMILPDLVFH